MGALALAGCGSVGEGDVQQVSGDVSHASAPPATASTIAFQDFTDAVGDRASSENRTLIRTARGYQSFFGHAPPASVDFSREWVIFYAAGTKPTGGYEASVLAVLRSGDTLIAITQLVSPGAACAVTEALTSPYALIKFPAQPGSSASFFKQDRTQDCATDACAAVLCEAGSVCDPTTGKCGPAPVRCGGIAGTACPGFGHCVDDPSDSCDPNAGGADCGGICSCVQNVLCTIDHKFDSSPSVCTCVPSAPPPSCPPEKCPVPAPATPTMICADGTTAGPTCVVTASGTCGWTITTCPTPSPSPSP